MQKMQILFPEPLLQKIRGVAEDEDRPVSEVIRRAVENFLEMNPQKPRIKRGLPTFRGGKILVAPGDLKANLYPDEPL
jgi:predicted transcriptional regulator